MKHRIFTIAVAALLLGGCTKQEQAFSSFNVDVAPFRSEVKTHWDAAGLWWDEYDELMVNGNVHTLSKNTDGTWKTTGEETQAIGGLFYVAYPDGAWDAGSKTVSGLTFDGSVVPLAAASSSNNITLTPCCAVVRVKGECGDLEFYTEDEEAGTVSGAIYESGAIDVARQAIIGDEEISYDGLFPELMDDDYTYFILPMGGADVKAVLSFEYGTYTTSSAVTLKKGYIYTVSLPEE